MKKNMCTSECLSFYLPVNVSHFIPKMRSDFIVGRSVSLLIEIYYEPVRQGEVNS